MMNGITSPGRLEFGYSILGYSFARGPIYNFTDASKGIQAYVRKESLIKATKTHRSIGIFYARCRAIPPNSEYSFQTVFIIGTHTFQSVNGRTVGVIRHLNVAGIKWKAPPITVLLSIKIFF